MATPTDHRALIAAALSAVPGISAHQAQPATVSPGDAWPVWTGDEYRTPYVTGSAYAVFVALPADLATANEAAGGLRAAVVAALNAVPGGWVDRGEPTALTLTVAGDTLPALQFGMVVG